MTTPVISTPSAPAQVAAFESAFAALAAGPGSSDFASLLSTLTSASAQDTTATSSAAATTGGSDVSGSDVSGSEVVADAQKYLGVPYKWGGTTTAGFDCSGLTQHVFADLGISIPRTAAEQQAMPNAQHIDSLADAQPGDLLFFGSPAHHVGIYVGNGQMLNAPHTGTDVRVESVYEKPTSILRVTGTSATSSAAATGASGSISGSLNVPSQYASDFLSAGAKYGVSPTLLAAVAKTESNFNPSAVSPAGAIGIMQLMPGTAAGLGVDPHNAKQSIDGGAELLARDIKQFGSVSLGLAAYNAGPGAVSKYGGIPPYPETEAYVTKVMSLAGLSS